jgi:hypothetical protein
MTEDQTIGPVLRNSGLRTRPTADQDQRPVLGPVLDRTAASTSLVGPRQMLGFAELLKSTLDELHPVLNVFLADIEYDQLKEPSK